MKVFMLLDIMLDCNCDPRLIRALYETQRTADRLPFASIVSRNLLFQRQTRQDDKFHEWEKEIKSLLHSWVASALRTVGQTG
jgi:hypothetical protein